MKTLRKALMLAVAAFAVSSANVMADGNELQLKALQQAIKGTNKKAAVTLAAGAGSGAGFGKTIYNWTIGQAIERAVACGKSVSTSWTDALLSTKKCSRIKAILPFLKDIGIKGGAWLKNTTPGNSLLGATIGLASLIVYIRFFAEKE